MNIRRAVEADAPGILRVHTAAVRGLAAEDYPQDVIDTWSRPRPLEDYRASMAINPFLVAEKDGEIAGFAELETALERIRSVYVSPSHARQGVASALMTALENEARSRGLDELRLDSSLTAVPFYESCGFQEVGRDTFALPDGSEMASVQMRKVLG